MWDRGTVPGTPPETHGNVPGTWGHSLLAQRLKGMSPGHWGCTQLCTIRGMSQGHPKSPLSSGDLGDVQKGHENSVGIPGHEWSESPLFLLTHSNFLLLQFPSNLFLLPIPLLPLLIRNGESFVVVFVYHTHLLNATPQKNFCPYPTTS